MKHFLSVEWDEIFGYFDHMIEQCLFWVLLLFCALYAGIHFFLGRGIKGLFRPKAGAAQQPISVIIAARNEGRNITTLLSSLTMQDYPSDLFEIVIADDRSTDDTALLVETLQQQFPNIRLIRIEANNSDMPNKKNALRAAIAQSKHDILAFTDADCRLPSGWLREISANFTDEVGVVAGYSPYLADSANSFLRYEEYKNSLISASAIELGYGFMCTGRNLAYRRNVYNEVNGFEKIKHSISGDDDLFLQLVRHSTSWKIRYMISPDSYVFTLPPDTFSAFVHQRIRHISASKFYPKSVQAFYGSIHLFHLVLFLTFFISPLFALIVLMIKFNIDGAFIASGKNIFHEEFSLPAFVADEFLLVLYSFFIGPLGFLKKFDWKGTGNS